MRETESQRADILLDLQVEDRQGGIESLHKYFEMLVTVVQHV